jgi:hypothetical protein
MPIKTAIAAIIPAVIRKQAQERLAKSPKSTAAAAVAATVAALPEAGASYPLMPSGSTEELIAQAVLAIVAVVLAVIRDKRTD